MSDVDISASVPDPFEGRYAGFWQRFAAACVDMVIFAPLYYFIKRPSGYGHGYFPVVSELVFVTITLIPVVIPLLAYAVFFSSRLQASPGMWLLRFHVTDKEGHRLTFKGALLWGIVSLIGVIICCGALVYMQLRFDMNSVNQLMLSCYEEQLLMDDCIHEAELLLGFPYDTYKMMVGASAALTLFMLLVWALSVALAKDKVGFHNLICGTRFHKGRP